MDFDFPPSLYSEYEHSSDFIDDNDFTFPDIPCKYPGSPQPESHDAVYMSSPKKSLVDNDAFASLPVLDLMKNEPFELEDMSGLEDLLTAPQGDLNLEDLLSLFMSPPDDTDEDRNKEEEIDCPNSPDLNSTGDAHLSNFLYPCTEADVHKDLDLTFNSELTSHGKTTKRKRGEELSNKSRRKEYISCLQHQVNSLLSKQAMLDSGSLLDVPEPKLQQGRVRKMHIQMFLAYRTRGIIDRSCWSEVLDEAFVLTSPCTPFCQPSGQLVGNKRKIAGIDAIIKDTGALAAFVESIVNRCNQLKPGFNGDVQFVFAAESSEIMIVEDKATCHWALTTQGLCQFGFSSEASVDGMLFCRFTNQHKISLMEMTFDVLNFSDQLTSKGLLEAPSSPTSKGCASPTSFVNFNSVMNNQQLQSTPLTPSQFSGFSMFPFSNGSQWQGNAGSKKNPPISPCPKLLPARRIKPLQSLMYLEELDLDESEQKQLRSRRKKTRGDVRKTKSTQPSFLSSNSFSQQALLYQHLFNAVAMNAQSNNFLVPSMGMA